MTLMAAGRAALLRLLDTPPAGLALCLVPPLLVHARTLTFGFYHDDLAILPLIGLDRQGLFYHEWYFRPVTALMLLVSKSLSGSRPLGYHAINLTLHLANTALVYALGLRVLGRPRLAGLAAAGWSLLLWNTYPIIWATDGLLPSTAFALAALVLFWRGLGSRALLMRTLAAICLALALLAKESTIPVVLLLWLAAWRLAGLPPKAAFRATLPFWGVLLAYAAVRTVLLQGHSFKLTFGGGLLRVGEGDVSVWAAGMALNYLRQLAFLLLPVPSISPDAVGLAFITVVLVLGGSLILLVRREREAGPRLGRALEYGAAWCLLAVLPFVTGSHPRLQYLAGVGLALLLAAGAGIALAASPSRPLLASVTGAALGLFLLGNAFLSFRIQTLLAPDSPTILRGYVMALAAPPMTGTGFELDLRAYLRQEIERHGGCAQVPDTPPWCRGDTLLIDLNDVFQRYQPGVRIRRYLEERR